jgi:hypothetical protein
MGILGRWLKNNVIEKQKTKIPKIKIPKRKNLKKLGVCSKCGKNNVEDISMGMCKSCYAKDYYKTNKEKIEIQKKKWIDKNRDKVNKSNCKSYYKNKQARILYQARYKYATRNKPEETI